ncbi:MULTISPECIES: MaoC/PaaZ C-terminal domain-containing protein [unclassified Luteococcus]|uniref:MaoC/PaaZ C-terminal domain-containing protein n=1 Tax=unclassified Luteococcus TaxID=2639923 RepID=UPI00313ABED1
MSFDPSTVAVGDRLPDLDVHITRERIVRYSGASTDLNPIHFSDRHARAIGLPGVVAHGMWTMGTALRVVTDWCEDPARVKSYFVRFTRPIQVPDDDQGLLVQFGGTVTAVADGMASVALTATCVEDKVLGAVTVEVAL